jgi:hypothetical protein
MRLRAVPHGLTLAANEDGFERAPGLHLSAIYGRLLKKLDPKRFGKWEGGKAEEFDWTRMELGMCFEPAIERELKRRIEKQLPGGAWRPDPYVEMIQTPAGLWIPLHYSPDLFVYGDDGDVWLGEIKMTWMSDKQWIPKELAEAGEWVNHTDKKYDKWLFQIMGYCYLLKLTKARLYVYWVVGDYSDKAPHFKYHYDLEFSQRELQENWDMLMNFADDEGMLIAV